VQIKLKESKQREWVKRIMIECKDCGCKNYKFITFYEDELDEDRKDEWMDTSSSDLRSTE